MKYSATAGCFFFDGQTAPADAITVSDEEARLAMGRDPLSALAVIDGALVVVPEPAEQALQRAKGQMAEAMRARAGVSEYAPVQVGPYLMRGGAGSAMDLKGQLDLTVAIAQRLPELKISTVKFYDVNGEEIEVPIESDTEVDAWDIVIAVALQVSTVRFKQVGLERAIAEANSKAELDALKWSE